MEIPGVHANGGLPLKISIKRKSGETIGRQDSGYAGPSTVTSPVMETVSRKLTRPELSYAELITEALAESPHGLLSLQEIYESIRKRYCFFKSADAAWQNSIRHNLSVNATFVKVPRPVNRPGKGSLWATTRIPHRNPEEVFTGQVPQDFASKPKRFSRKSDTETAFSKLSRPKENRKMKKRVKKQRRSRGDESESFESEFSSDEEPIKSTSMSPEPIPRKRGRPPAAQPSSTQTFPPQEVKEMVITESESETDDDSLVRAPRLPPLEPNSHRLPVPLFSLPGMPTMTVPKRIQGLGITSKPVPWDDYEPDLPTLRYRPIAPPMVPHVTATPAAFGTRPGHPSMTPFLSVPGEGKSLNPSPIPFSYSLSRATSPCSFFVGSQYGSFLPHATPQGLGLNSPNSSPLHGSFAPSSPVSPNIRP
jgi:hypothetical protein